MDKRYQVFISSTYADLKDERRNVFQALMEMDCIPAGMELFPASDDDQWEFIKRVIDDCDYYMLIIGGRYGSMTAEGISYTEKEFDYAVEHGIRVIALVHEEPDSLPLAKSELDPITREKLTTFREKVCTGRLVKFWKAPAELAGLAVLSLTKTIKFYPALGWIRPTSQASNAALSEINELRKDNAALRGRLLEYEAAASAAASGIAELDTDVEVEGKETYSIGRSHNAFKRPWTVSLTWRRLFSLIAPYLMNHPNDETVKLQLSIVVWQTGDFNGTSPEINDQLFRTISIQFKALGLVKIDYLATNKGGMALFWSLTKRGEHLMISERIVKSTQPPD